MSTTTESPHCDDIMTSPSMVFKRGQATRHGMLRRVVPVLLLLMLPHVGAQVPDMEAMCEAWPDLMSDGARMNESVAWQVSLGPRLPDSDASKALLASVVENNSGWTFEHDIHSYMDGNMTNLVAKYTPSGATRSDHIIALGAHYDTRDRAERETDEANQSQPIPGANDGASGVAVVLEMMRLVPAMDLPHPVMVVLFDAEDQGPMPGLEGSRRWADNLSEQEIASIDAFLLLDMVGDADLNLARITSNSDSVAAPIPSLAEAVGLVAGTTACDGSSGADVYQHTTSANIIDDHINTQAVGIPSAVIIDHRYGDGATRLADGHWHTLDDTPDKVSAESLAHVARLVELGLRTGSWQVPEPIAEENTTNANNDLTNEAVVAAPLLALVAVWTALGLLTTAFVASIVLLRRLRNSTSTKGAWSWDG